MKLITKFVNRTDTKWCLPYGFDISENMFHVEMGKEIDFPNKNVNDIYAPWEKIVLRQSRKEGKVGKFHVDLHERKRFKRDENKEEYYLDLLNSGKQLNDSFKLSDFTVPMPFGIPVRVKVLPVAWECEYKKIEIFDPHERIIPDPYSSNGIRRTSTHNIVMTKRNRTEIECLKELRGKIKADLI